MCNRGTLGFNLRKTILSPDTYTILSSVASFKEKYISLKWHIFKIALQTVLEFPYIGTLKSVSLFLIFINFSGFPELLPHVIIYTISKTINMYDLFYKPVTSGIRTQ